MKLLLLFIVCTILFLPGYAQKKTTSIRGTVADSVSRETLEQATVSLMNTSDSSLQKQAISGRNGFDIRRVGPGTYLLGFSYTGYKTKIIPIRVEGLDSTYWLDSVFLVRSDGDLLEVVVRAVIPPVIVKNDTIVYNANAVTTKPNATIEDLLKKLPGIEVDKDGNITLHGQKVEKVYIDGKEFFLNDPKVATQNLTADMVDAVEAFENQSDRARFTGIRDMNVNKAINLRLKKDKKKGLFGNATATAGTLHNYSGNATVTYFRGDRWLFGNLGVDFVDNLSSTVGLKKSNSNRSLNYREDFSTRAQLVVNYSGNDNHYQSGQLTRRQTFLGDSSLLQDKNIFYDNKFTHQRFNFSLTYTVDSFSSVVYTPTLSWQRNKSMNTDNTSILSEKNGESFPGNEGQTMNNISAHGTTITNNLAYRRKFRKKGRSIYITLLHERQQQDQDGSLYSSVKVYDNSGALLQDKITDQQYEQNNRNNRYNVNLSYTEPLKENHVIDLGYIINHSSNASERLAFNYDPATGLYDQPDTLTTNTFTNNQTQQTFSAGYNYIGKEVQYQAGMSLLYTTMENESDNHSYLPISQHTVNWSPRASARYRLSNRQNLRIQYNGNSFAPSPQMLQPIPNLSDPFLVRLGNPDLKQQFRHRVNINYNGSNSKKFTNLSIQAGGDYTMNRIVLATRILDAGVQELQYVNINGVYGMDAGFNFGFSFDKGKKGGGQVSTRIQYDRDISFINGQQNIRRGINWTQGASLNYRVKENLYLNLSGTINYTRSAYSIGKSLNTEFLTQNYAATVTYVLPWGINLSSDFTRQINGKQGRLPGRTFSVWNVSLYRNILRNNRCEIKISGFDLLNKNTGFNQTNGYNYIETRESYVLQRYFALSLRYNFRRN